MFVNNLYDSHVHLLLSGMAQMELPLKDLSRIDDLAQLKILPQYFRRNFLMGFGWDENLFNGGKLPTRQLLDKYFPEVPVYFVRCDGHSAWLNSKALIELGLMKTALIDPLGGQFLREESDLPSGILTETAHFPFYEKLSQLGESDYATALQEGINLFNRNGFTHIRDLSGTERQWNYLSGLADRRELTLFIEDYFSCENINDFDSMLRVAVQASKSNNPFMRAKGIKFYIDGSLGSDTALLSKPYAHRNDDVRGLSCTEFSTAKEVVRKTWEAGLDIAVHTIGDEAAHQMVLIAREVSSSGISGKINLEHSQVLRLDTIQLMKGIHVHCHLQPCHWLSDKKWLKKKLGSLYQSAFPWENLRLNNVPFSFGSDSPIEKPSIFDNLIALSESVSEGIKKLNAHPLDFHVYSGRGVAQGKTWIENNQIQKVEFDGKMIFSI